MRITALALRAIEDWAAASRPLDTFVREVRSILNGGVTLTEQMAGEVKTIRYIGDETVSVATRVRPLAVLCLAARSATTGIPDTLTGSMVTWSYDNGAIAISAITGISAGADFLVTLWIVEG